VTAFSAAIDAIFMDPNLAVDATWLRGGFAPGLPVRAIRSRPDDMTDFGAGRILTDVRRLDVRMSEMAEPRTGDMIVIGTERLVIQSPPRADRERLVWSIDARPE